MKKILSLLIVVLMLSISVFGCVTTGESSKPGTSSTLGSSEVSSESSSEEVSSSSQIVPEEANTSTIEYIDTASKTLTSAEKDSISKLFYKNELGKVSGADPACIYVSTEQDPVNGGYFYMYTTGSSGYFTCYRSKNLTSWEKLANSLDKNCSYADFKTIYPDATQSDYNYYISNTLIKYNYTWAPGVIYDAELKLYLMYFSNNTVSGALKLQPLLAVSKTPQGPFIQWTGHVDGGEYANGYNFSGYDITFTTPFIDFERLNGVNGNYPYEGFIKVIDVEPFVDPKTGDKYLFMCRDLGGGGNYNTSSVMGMKMIDWFTPDYSTLTLLTQASKKTPDSPSTNMSDEGDVNEGPYVIYNETNRKYYLTYSVHYYWEKSYAVKQAVSDNPLGPYLKLDQASDGYVIKTNDWPARAGTGHHVFTKVGNELFIVYHMHTSPEKYTKNDLDQFSKLGHGRCIGVDKVSWIENKDGILVMTSNGPSMGYMPQAEIISGYSNLASQATFTTDNTNEKIATLNNSFIAFFANRFNTNGVEYVASAEQPLKISMAFANKVTVKALSVFNSVNISRAFDYISSIEIDYEVGGVYYRKQIGRVNFDWDSFYNNLYKDVDADGTKAEYPTYMPGCPSVVMFDEISNVYNITINLVPREGAESVAVSEIYVLGKNI